MQVLYDERAETPLGPFSVEAKLAGQRGLQTFAWGKGRARNKQLAKQVRHLAQVCVWLAQGPAALCWGKLHVPYLTDVAGEAEEGVWVRLWGGWSGRMHACSVGCRRLAAQSIGCCKSN